MMDAGADAGQCGTGSHWCATVAQCEADNDSNHCGPSCVKCPGATNGDPACVNNSCIVTCHAGYINCGESCIDPLSDESHCGATVGCGIGSGRAGAVCATGRVCAIGRCGCIASIASSIDFCALRTDMKLWCWGPNDNGEVGDGTMVAVPMPIQVATSIFNLTQIAMSWYSTCASRADGSVWCWGNNAFYQLGNESNTDSSIPVHATAAGFFDQVAPGAFHTCARKNDGTIWCWGAGTSGQLGNGSMMSSPTAVQAGNTIGGPFDHVVSSVNRSCALKHDGTVWCWGDNSNGALGNGNTVNSDTPVQPANSESATFRQIATAPGHSCALKSDGTLWCWGNNNVGQLGDGTTTNSLAPVRAAPSLGSTLTSVSAGDNHTCAVTNDGGLWCWGIGSGLGNGSGVNSPTPVQPENSSGGRFIQVAAGKNHTCAAKDDGTLWCWGENIGGTKITASSSSPVQVSLACP